MEWVLCCVWSGAALVGGDGLHVCVHRPGVPPPRQAPQVPCRLSFLSHTLWVWPLSASGVILVTDVSLCLLRLPVLDSYLSSCVLSVSCLRRFKDRKLAVRKDAKFAEAAPEDILEAMAAQQAAAVRDTDPLFFYK